MQEKLDVIAIDIGRLGMYAAIIIFHLLVARNMIESTIFRKFSAIEKDKLCFTMKADAEVSKSGIKYYCEGELGPTLKSWFEFIIVGVAIVVVAVPEGLPLAVMISLAYSV